MIVISAIPAAALVARRTARNDAAACHDEPIAAPSLNSQYAPRPRDKISGRYVLRAIATVNHRNAVPYIFDAIASEQGPRVVGSSYLVRGGRFRSCRKRRWVRRGGREGLGRTCGRDGGSLLQLIEPRREASKFGGRRRRDGDFLLNFVEPRHDIGKFSGRRRRRGGFFSSLSSCRNIGQSGRGIWSMRWLS